VAPNITPNGIGDWTNAEIADAITKGVRRDGRRIMPPMAIPYYANLSPSEVKAIVSYLRSLPPR